MERIKLLLAIAFVCQCLACSKFDKQETSYLNLEGNHFVFSEKITTKDAGMLAKLFVRETFPDTKASSESEIKNVFPIKGDNNERLAYVVNFGNGGYNIVSANRKYLPIIAFNDTGELKEKDFTEGTPFKFYFDIIAQDIIAVTENDAVMDSTSMNIERQWEHYDSLAHNSTMLYSGGNHIYWYGQERTNAMNSPFNYLMSQDLQKYNSLTVQSYSGTRMLSDAEIKNYESENNLIKVNYAAAGLSSAHVASYFWNEYHKNYIVYNSYPLVYTKWHQHEPYNKYNPDRTDIEGLKQPAGCVTLAVSQILNYYSSPQTLKRKSGNRTYSLDIDWTKTQCEELGVNDSNEEIPKLIRFVNLGVDTENGNTGSGSNIDKAKSFFQLNGYDVEKGEGVNTNLWENEIRNGRPVYVRGYDVNAGEGHAFICCGYKEVSQIVTLELKATKSFEVSTFTYNPYKVVQSLKGEKVYSSTVYFCFNWGWGYDLEKCWITKPLSTIDYGANSFADVKYLLVRK